MGILLLSDQGSLSCAELAGAGNDDVTRSRRQGSRAQPGSTQRASLFHLGGSCGNSVRPLPAGAEEDVTQAGGAVLHAAVLAWEGKEQQALEALWIRSHKCYNGQRFTPTTFAAGMP